MPAENGNIDVIYSIYSHFSSATNVSELCYIMSFYLINDAKSH